MDHHYIHIHSLPAMSEPVSCLTHLLGAVVFAVLAGRLLGRARGEGRRVVSLGVFAAATLGLLLVSGFYHLVDRGAAAREVMVRIDHAAIFLLIAASFTPVHVILLRGAARWVPLALIWIAALAGLAIKVIYFDQIPIPVGVAMYLALGWGGVVSAILLARRYGIGCIRPLLWGGLAYTLGAGIELSQRLVIIPGVVESHEVFHVAVLLGLGAHWSFAFQFADGRCPWPRRIVRRTRRRRGPSAIPA